MVSAGVKQRMRSVCWVNILQKGEDERELEQSQEWSVEPTS